ncbi:class II aldolase/adducin family protein, partial [Rubripirellula obstinata]
MSHFPNERTLMCEVGRRMYAREFVAAHEGNLSIRLPDGNVLCTPTMRCKGFLEP